MSALELVPAFEPLEDPWRPIRLCDVQPRPPVDPLCGPLLLRGETTVLYGDGGTGKSLLAAGFAVAIAAGVEVVPGWTPASGNVLILDWETREDAWHDRTRRIAAGVGLDAVPDGLMYVRASQELASGETALLGLVQRLAPMLLIVDSTAYALAPTGQDADPKDAVIAMHRVLRRLDVAALVIDHVSKGGGLYGSVFKSNAVREVFELKHRRGRLRLRHTKANYRERLGEICLQVTFDGEDGQIRFGAVNDDGVAGTSEPSSIRGQVRSLLDANPNLTNPELQSLTGAKAGTVRKYVSEWRKRAGRHSKSVCPVVGLSPVGRTSGAHEGGSR